MENSFITENICSTDDYSKSLEYIIPDSTISTSQKSVEFRSIANGLLSEGFYLGHNLTENIHDLKLQNSNSCILSIPVKGKYSIWLSNRQYNACTSEKGSLLFPTDSIRYSTKMDEVDDLMIILSYDQLKPILESKYNIRSIKEKGIKFYKRNEKFQVICSFIYTNLEAIKLFPHLQESLYLKLSIQETAKIFLAELIADSLNAEKLFGNSPDSVYVKYAEELMAATPEKYFSIQQIADKVSTSPRNLQLSFQKYRDYPPMQFLRERKLFRAWSFLIDPGQDTSVKKIAYDSGFLNLSTFSKYYRELFGELPSETLEIAKRSAGFK